MKRVWGLILLNCFVLPAAADNVPMFRVLSCDGEDAKMEVYVPQAFISGTGVANAKLDQAVIGAYALDLSAAGKGKSLEPVRVRLTVDKKAIVVDQFTRGLPPTQVPVGGGTVDFDQRFGTNAKCGPFNSE